uniref:Putative integrase/recombinase n=1 Tax=Spirogyra maxima TaxID=3180 RepID=A0A191T4M1_SPIMX|nr:putative integrase/recombinase [Spirogyra maxima]ANI25339.1 putative integrase/recombinase [Spirogyra maxima]
MILNNSNSKVNKLQGEYLSSNLNQVWTVDITTIKNKYYFFFIVDLASRRVIYYDVSRHDYNAAEAKSILLEALKEEDKVIPQRPVQCIHTDSGKIFLSKEWLDCLKVNNIAPSSSNSQTHQNQVSERFNRTFKKLLRDKLNTILNKRNNRTNTLQLIGEATKHNFDNLKPITDELILYYNSEKPHSHINNLTPNAWANQARQLPEQKYIFSSKEGLVTKESSNECLLGIPEEEIKDRIEIIQTNSDALNGYTDLRSKDPSEIVQNIYDLQSQEIIPFVPLSKNDNSEKARLIREYKNNVGSLELIDHIKDHKIDLSKLDLDTQQVYEDLSKQVNSWKETDVRYLETIMLQNQILLSSVNELKLQNNKLLDQNNKLLNKTDVLEAQNQELLDMNHYLVETAEKTQEKERLAFERKEKKKRAIRTQKRDYITPKEFYEIIYNYIHKCETNQYIISRNKIAFIILFFTGLRVSNLLLFTVRNIRELVYDNLGTEVPIIKGGRPNQLISLGEDAQNLLLNHFYDDILVLLRNKNDNDFVFTSESNNLSSLHRVTFTQSLNRILKYASEEFHKKISCHSFRVTFITEGIMNNIPIHVIQKTVGHKNIQSTEHYIRHDLSESELKKIITATNRERANGLIMKMKEDELLKKKTIASFDDSIQNDI